jgi:hypothetical protein
MNEDFLHYVWKYRLLVSRDLRTTAGEVLHVIHPGQHNVHAGPDFQDARIRLGDQLWAGQVEIHVRSSDWNRHAHKGDARYFNVVLHVVYEHDAEVRIHAQGDLPVLDLKQYISPGLWEKYQKWLSEKNQLPCAPELHRIESMTWTHWKDRLLAERLERKSQDFLRLLDQVQGNVEEAFYHFLARGMGFRLNADPFEQLARSLPRTVLLRYRYDTLLTEALIFGQSGLLPELPQDEYPRRLLSEYRFLQLKHGIVPLTAAQWNTGRIRPANHPCLRLAQFAAAVVSADGLFARLKEEEDTEAIRAMFDRPVNPYWKGRWWFDDAGAAREIRRSGEGRMGKESLDLLMINTVAVALAAFGKRMGEERMLDKAVKIIEFCKAESNVVMRQWALLGVQPDHAADSQALTELRRMYCEERHCLRCMIGHQLIRTEAHAESDSELF